MNKLKVKGYKFIGGRGGKENSSEKRRLKQYSPVSDENYDDLNDKVKEVLENDSSEVEGI